MPNPSTLSMDQDYHQAIPCCSTGALGICTFCTHGEFLDCGSSKKYNTKCNSVALLYFDVFSSAPSQNNQLPSSQYQYVEIRLGTPVASFLFALLSFFSLSLLTNFLSIQDSFSLVVRLEKLLFRQFIVQVGPGLL